LRKPPFPEVPSQVLYILERLRQAQKQAFIVGGAVRDALMGRPIKDWDVATSAKVDLVRSLFPKVIPTGARHGTVTVKVGGLEVEVSAFRGRTIVEDLGHRDFTVDAMAWDPQGPTLLDPFGGIGDLKDRLLRGVIDPLKRFLEDPLRALRGVRLAGELELEIEPSTKRAMEQVAGLLEGVAKERVMEELDRIVLLPSPMRALLELGKSSLLASLIPEVLDKGLPTAEDPECLPLEHLALTLENLPQDRSLRWAGLLHRLGVRCPPEEAVGPQEVAANAAFSVLTRLRAPGRTRKEASHIILHHALSPKRPWSWPDAREFILDVGEEYALAIVKLRIASLEAWSKRREDAKNLEGLEEMVRSLIQEEGGLSFLKPALDGSEAMEILGLGPGPELGRVIQEMRREVARNPELNEKEKLRAWLLSRHSKRAKP
jgi:tRNA nucleotidyltransferase (CCA-adding enzyme)